jgi:Flp pilus assembly CpaF family ATPase/pSer/pThr/pTyr-binding forkhead associated (FHA) protein
MIVWYNHITDAKQYRKEISSSLIRIGRNPANDIVLPNPFIAENAAVLHCKSGVWELHVLSLNGLLIGEQQLYGGDRFLLHHSETIKIFPYDITLDLPKKEEITRQARIAELDRQFSEFTASIHRELLNRMNLDMKVDVGKEIDDVYLLSIEKHIEGIAKEYSILTDQRVKIVDHLAGYSVRDEVLQLLSTGARKPIVGVLQEGRHWGRLMSSIGSLETELIATAKHIVTVLKTDEQKELEDKIALIDKNFWECWETILAKNSIRLEFRHYLSLRYLKKNIKDIVFGFGPLEDLLRLPTISEIMVVNSDHIFVEKSGRIENSGRRFLDDETTVTIINRIAANVNRSIDKSRPLVDARLADGSRVNAIIDPLSVTGPCLTIRKFPESRLLVDDLVRMKALSQSAAEFLRASVLNRRNIIISGGTGSGKTTLLNCLSDFIPDNERIVTVEDTAELRINKEHLVGLEARNANAEGKGAYTIRDLVRNALRMRPDRIVIGECRGPEALDMLQAMNTGHDGSLTTIHANSAADVILRLEVLVQMAADLPIASIHRQVSSAVDLIVQLTRMKNGKRCVSQIAEVTNIDPITREIVIHDLFLIENEASDDAQLVPTGILPSYMDVLVERDIINPSAFYL